ncbi:hypothetical protein TrRE_jg1683 [Triparma retinervis]|uniref:Uncharacterized protein n=1 Tax=Triparma retinervis TaxID=2557542 RepID=A0A9W7A736_9STRA|nr:hypothetical protein TrRE_jg1683 [Triparma retinervis]
MLSQPNPWEDLDKFIEKKRGGPENAEELRKLAIEKLEEAEEDIKRERKELTEAIEEERRKADYAREDRTMSMSLDLDDKIDAMIGGFMDEVGGGAASGGSQAKGDGDSATSTGADGGDVDVPRLPTSIMYIPIDDSVPQPYPSSGSQTSSPNPTTVVIGTSSKTLNPKTAKAFLKANEDKFKLKAIEKVVILSNLGTERTGKFPWNMQNGLGGALAKNGEGEQVLVEHFRKACKGNVPPVGTFVIKTGEGDVDEEAKSGGVLGGEGEDRASLLVGDMGKGGCDGKTLEMVVDNIAQERGGGLGNVTASVFGWSGGGGEREVKMLLEKLEGPEVSRIVIDVKDGGEAERRALILLSDVVAGMQKGGKTVTKVELDEKVGEGMVGVKFKESGAGWDDKKGGGDKDDWGDKKEEKPTVVGGRGLRQGGVLCKVDGLSYVKKLIVSFSRYNYPKPWERKEVPVKLMTEESVIRELRRAVEEIEKTC